MKRFLPGSVRTELAALLVSLAGVAGCGPFYEYTNRIEVRLASDTDVSVDIVDVPVTLSVEAKKLCTVRDEWMDDGRNCEAPDPEITDLRVGPLGAAVPLRSDGVLEGYVGGTYAIEVELDGERFEHQVVFPTVHAVDFAPDPLVADKPITATWMPHGQKGIFASLGVTMPDGGEWFGSGGVEDDGEQTVEPMSGTWPPGTYEIRVRRHISGSYDERVLTEDGDTHWWVSAYISRSKSAVLSAPSQ